MLNKGFVIVAVKNTSGVDYLRHAAALAASIKKNCKINDVCLITNYRIPQRWQGLFDHVVRIDSQPSEWTQDILSRIYDLSPFHETIHIESDCLVLSNIDHWWAGCQHHDVLFTTKVKTVRGDISAQSYRKHFERSDLPLIYSGLYYFRKSALARSIHFTMSWVVTNWADIRNTVFDPNLNFRMGNDEVAAVALALSNIDELKYTNPDLPYPSMCHMKSKINSWPELDLTKSLGVFLDSDFNLYVNNYLQQGIWHYQQKEFLTDEILNRYVASILPS